MELIDMAQVVDIHPESNSVDVVLMRNGQRIANVQVLHPSAGSTFGHIDLAIPDLTDPDKYETIRTDTQDIYCLVCATSFRPVCLGFLYPQRSQMLFEEKERRLDRHTSDVYTSVDKDGNVEVYHPSGTFLRIGVDSQHEDLTGLDYDQLWAIEKNTDKAVDVRIHVRNAGGFKSEILLTKDGELKIQTVGDITVEGGEDISVTAVGDISMTTGGTMTLEAEQLNVNAPVVITGDSVSHNGINIGDDHVHSGVDPGGGDSGPPLPLS